MISHEGDAGKWILVFSSGILSHCAERAREGFALYFVLCGVINKSIPIGFKHYLRLQNVPNVHDPGILNLNLKRHNLYGTGVDREKIQNLLNE
jgi:hypothetical protein